MHQYHNPITGAQNSMLSQFLHGEQGALLCTAKIVETVPWIDAKYYASTQVMDEARHVEAFQRGREQVLEAAATQVDDAVPCRVQG